MLDVLLFCLVLPDMSIIQGRGGTGDAIVVPRGTLGKDNNIKDGRQMIMTDHEEDGGLLLCAPHTVILKHGTL